MKSTTSQKEPIADIITLDASGQRLGDLAVRVAHLLQGKDRIDFVYHQDRGHKVIVENIQKLNVSAKKLDKKMYWRYTGYPGGIHSKTLKDAWQQDPKKVLRHAVSGMLPKNKLRDDRLKRFEIK